MLKIILIALVGIVAVILIYAATRPDSFQVQRTVSIKASADKIFPQINDFHNWVAWSPYEKIDPNMKKTYTGPESGKGTVYEWEGNRMVGKGRMEIIDSLAPNKIVLKLDFDKPIEGHNIVEFTLSPSGDTTEVTWAMSGRTAYVAKIVGIFVSMDHMIGKEFATGLNNLKALTQK